MPGQTGGILPHAPRDGGRLQGLGGRWRRHRSETLAGVQTWIASRHRRDATGLDLPTPGFRLGGRNDGYAVLGRRPQPAAMPAKGDPCIACQPSFSRRRESRGMGSRLHGNDGVGAAPPFRKASYVRVSESGYPQVWRGDSSPHSEQLPSRCPGRQFLRRPARIVEAVRHPPRVHAPVAQADRATVS